MGIYPCGLGMVLAHSIVEETEILVFYNLL